MKDSITRLIKSYFFYFSIMIALKFIIFRYVLLYDTNIFRGIWFEFMVVLTLIAAFELVLKKGKVYVYIVLDVILTLLFISMLVYERYFGTIPTYYDLTQLNQVGSVNESAMMLFRPTDLLFFADLVLFAILTVWTRKWGRKTRNYTSNVWMGSLLVIGLIASIVNFQMSKSDPMLDSALFAKENGLFNSQFVQFYQDRANSETALAFSGADQNVTQEMIEETKGNDYVPMSEHNHFGVAEDRNLIVIQVESLQNFVIGKSLNGQEITPNINKWIKDSMYFSNLYQQIGSANTADAEYLMNTSLYPLGSKATSEEMTDMKIPSLPRILDQNGYHSVTMHADEVEYWNRDVMYPALGFDDYYAKEFYGEKDTVGFGPSDGVFFERSLAALDNIADKEGKFYAHALTLTSHTPFEMPEDKEGLDLPEEYEGTLTGNYLQSVHYADQELGKFFQGLKDKGLWENSVIAMYGDHSGLHGKLLTSKDQDLLDDFIGGRYSLAKRFNIPFVIGVPGEEEELSGEVDHLGGQIDMMPTVLNLLGVEPDTIYFGHDLLHYEDNLLGMRYYVPTSSFFKNGRFYIAENSRFAPRIIDLETNERIENQYDDPKASFAKEQQDILQLLEWSDAYFESLK
ncbi:LTA synthase family protein [Bacillus sp. SB49]|uniref:LTA synthase family protein n=1 Tax=Bacillus sp. SB49 TaxID=1071080 RepID=UPI0004290416|nr:LTA synthase family protein [Bacillus sp. SB49]QHT47786.1 LTA synthase family protein [Bacillus sp. SB49]